MILEHFTLRQIVSAWAVVLTAMLMGFGNGIGSGIVMTLSADVSPEIGRPKFLGLWREFSDAGQGVGPLILSGVTAVAGLVAGVIVSGTVGFAAAAVLWAFIPRRAPGQGKARGGGAASPGPPTVRAAPGDTHHADSDSERAGNVHPVRRLPAPPDG